MCLALFPRREPTACFGGGGGRGTLYKALRKALDRDAQGPANLVQDELVVLLQALHAVPQGDARPVLDGALRSRRQRRAALKRARAGSPDRTWATQTAELHLKPEPKAICQTRSPRLMRS